MALCFVYFSQNPELAALFMANDNGLSSKKQEDTAITKDIGVDEPLSRTGEVEKSGAEPLLKKGEVKPEESIAAEEIGEIEKGEAVKEVFQSDRGEEKTIIPTQVASKGKDKDLKVKLTREEKIEEKIEEKPSEKPEVNNRPLLDYFIKVCSCAIKENSEDAYKKLSALGYTPVIKHKMKQVKMYNVYSEVFYVKSEAEAFIDSFKKEKFPPLIVQLPEGGFTVRIESCVYKKSAKNIAKQLAGAGFTSRIVHELTDTKMYIVLLDKFESIEEAEAIREKLIQIGYESAAVTKIL